jgi:hypothetical protein
VAGFGTEHRQGAVLPVSEVLIETDKWIFRRRIVSQKVAKITKTIPSSRIAAPLGSASSLGRRSEHIGRRDGADLGGLEAKYRSAKGRKGQETDPVTSFILPTVLKHEMTQHIYIWLYA